MRPMAERKFRRTKYRRPKFNNDDLLLTVRLMLQYRFQDIDEVMDYMTHFEGKNIREEIERILAKPPTDTERAEMLIIKAMISSGDHAKKRFLTEAIALNPASALAFNALGEVSTDHSDAIAAYRRAEEILTPTVTPYLPIRTAAIPKAPAELGLWFKVLYNIAMVSRYAGQYDETISTVKRLLANNPTDDVGASAELIGAFILKGQLREANVVLETLAEQDALYYMLDGVILCLLNNDNKKARASFVQALFKNPLIPFFVQGSNTVDFEDETDDDNEQLNLPGQASYIADLLGDIFLKYTAVEEHYRYAVFMLTKNSNKSDDDYPF